MNKEIIEMAEKIIVVDDTSMVPLRNIARKISAIELETHGYYACVKDGIKTLFVLKPSKEVFSQLMKHSACNASFDYISNG